MAYFSSDSEVYATLGLLMQDVAASPGLGQRLQETNTVIQLVCDDPAAQLTLAFLLGAEPDVEFGSTSLSPTLTLSLPADTAHNVFLGKVNIYEPIGSGEVRLTGSARELLPVWPAVSFAVPTRYAQLLESVGRGDLINV